MHARAGVARTAGAVTFGAAAGGVPAPVRLVVKGTSGGNR